MDRISLTAEELVAIGSVEWRDAKGASRNLKPREARGSSPRLLVCFEGVRSREAAGALTNGEIWVLPEALPDPGPGTSYAFELLGMKLVNVDGREVGIVKEYVVIAERPLYVLEGPGELMIPAHQPFVKHVDFAAKVITVDLPPGFEDLQP